MLGWVLALVERHLPVANVDVMARPEVAGVGDAIRVRLRHDGAKRTGEVVRELCHLQLRSASTMSRGDSVPKNTPGCAV